MGLVAAGVARSNMFLADTRIRIRIRVCGGPRGVFACLNHNTDPLTDMFLVATRAVCFSCFLCWSVSNFVDQGRRHVSVLLQVVFYIMGTRLGHTKHRLLTNERLEGEYRELHMILIGGGGGMHSGLVWGVSDIYFNRP